MTTVGRLSAAALLLAAACAPRPAPASDSPADSAQGDTLRGMVAVVGSEPGTSVVLMMDGGTRAITLAGHRRQLEGLSGIEVAVWGNRSAGGDFQVDRFAVRASNGVPALDGVVERDGAAYRLRTTDGRTVAVPHLPQMLRDRPGTRVWLAGPLDRAPDSFGVVPNP